MKANRGVLIALGRDAWRCLLFDFVARRVSREINLCVCCGWVQFISMTPAVEMMLHPLQRRTEEPKSVRSFERKCQQLLGKRARTCNLQSLGKEAVRDSSAATQNDDSEFA